MTAAVGWRGRDRWLALGIGGFAFLVRIALDLHGRLALGDFDEGVYFGTANALARGVVPYRDFVSVHPPFSSLLFTVATGPFTALAGPRVGFIATRVLAALAGAITTWLIYRCARHLAGRRAAITASLLYATFAAAVFAESRVLLDPFMVVFAIGGTAVLLERRTQASGALAGLLLGLSVSTKLTGAVFVLAAIGVLMLLDRDRRRTLLAAGVAVGTFVLVALPFAVLAGPRSWFDQVVMAQLDRPTGVGLPGNIGSLTGRLSALVAWGPLGGRGTLPTLVLVVGSVVVLAALTWGIQRTMRRDVRAATWTAAAALAIIGLLVGPSFYLHYSVLAAVPLSILLGGSTASVLGRLDATTRPAIGTVVVVTIAVVLVGWQTKVAVLVEPPSLPTDIAASIDRLADDGCVYVDQPQVGFLSDIVPQDGLEHPLVDPFGGLLEVGRSESHSALDALWSEPAQRDLRAALAACEWVVLTDDPAAQVTWTPDTRDWFVATHSGEGLADRFTFWRTSRSPDRARR